MAGNKDNIEFLITLLDPHADEGLMTLNAARDFAKTHIASIDAEYDEKNEFPKNLWKLMGEHFLLGMTIPTEYGGTDQGYLHHLIATEQISGGSGGVGLSYIANTNLAMNQIKLNATEEQKLKYLPKLCTGEYVGALAMSEPNAGSDVMSMKLRAEKCEGGYKLTGGKQWITNGGEADVLVVYAVTDPEAGTKGITAFLVERGMKGFVPGKKEDKMGMRSSGTYQIHFDECFVPEANVMGTIGSGAKVLMSGLNYERLMLAGGALGLAQASLDFTAQYLQEREQFGRPLAANQAPAHEMAAMHSKIMAARTHAYTVAAAADRGFNLTNDLAASVFFEASDAACKITQQCITLCGGMGYTKDFPVERRSRDAQLYEIGGGARHIRLEVIARYLLAAYDDEVKLQAAFRRASSEKTPVPAAAPPVPAPV